MSDILKWYYALSFPLEWEDAVVAAAQHFDPAAERKTAMDNLLYLLSRCDNTADIYAQKGIGEDILRYTLSDLVTWAKNHHLCTGEMGISEMDWASSHVNAEIFRLGRLQFRFGKTIMASKRLGFEKGADIIEIHVPQGEPLDIAECVQSCRRAVEFFATYYPEYRYSYFTCESWLLDFQLKEFVRADSNILKFQQMFDVIGYYDSPQALRYLFDINPDKQNMSGIQKKIRAHLDGGGKLFEGYGVINKETFMEREAGK
ncbi:MAG: hypothetical protein E7409_00455 [Ruminococcaceae bacterium]|nr:hypothetical protein [Oscillospiraceae bacterium]